MNRRQKIIISVTGIFIVLLILVGLTYAYFLTKIQGNEESKINISYNSKSSYYLLNDFQRNNEVRWWTLSPSVHSTVVGEAVYVMGSSGRIVESFPKNEEFIRPTITLISGTLITGGNGTIDSPYTLS